MKQKSFFYIPSLSSTAPFKELTIGQYRNIIQANNNKPFLNIGFNLALIDTIEQNNIHKIDITSFDKYILAYQLRCNIFEKPIAVQQINYPFNRSIEHFICRPPTIKEDKEYYEYISFLNKEQADELLIAEVTKYINIKNISIFEEKIKIVRTFSINTLAECISYIDSVKNNVKEYYTKNNGQLIEYGVKLLLP